MGKINGAKGKGRAQSRRRQTREIEDRAKVATKGRGARSGRKKNWRVILKGEVKVYKEG